MQFTLGLPTYYTGCVHSASPACAMPMFPVLREGSSIRTALTPLVKTGGVRGLILMDKPLTPIAEAYVPQRVLVKSAVGAQGSIMELISIR